MAEPFTITLVSVSVISVAVCVYKSIDRLVSAPRELIRQGGQSTEEVIKTFAGELRKLFGSEPRISVNRRVIQTGGTAIRELALYKEVVLIREEWRNTTWKSSKSIEVEQPFCVKAGFDLNRLKFEVDPASNTVVATISDSTIVNVEHAGDFQVLKEEHGFWNRIMAVERDALLNSLPLKAQEEAEKLQLRDKAVEQLKLFLRPILPQRYALVIKCTDDTLDFPESRRLLNVPPATLTSLGLIEESVGTNES